MRRVKKIKNLQIGRTVTAKVLYKNVGIKPVKVYDQHGVEKPRDYSSMTDEEFRGVISFIDHKNSEVHVLTPEGFIKVIRWIDFAVWLWPKIKVFIQMIIDMFKSKDL